MYVKHNPNKSLYKATRIGELVNEKPKQLRKTYITRKYRLTRKHE